MRNLFVTHSTEETEALGEALAHRLAPGAAVALSGGLGAGKTAFTRGLARGLGVAGHVCSPTYAIVHEYPGDGVPSLVHFDMYRIAGPDDLESTGYFDYLGQDCVIAIEWSENISADLPADALHVHLEAGGHENERRITIEGGAHDHPGD